MRWSSFAKLHCQISCTRTLSSGHGFDALAPSPPICTRIKGQLQIPFTICYSLITQRMFAFVHFCTYLPYYDTNHSINSPICHNLTVVPRHRPIRREILYNLPVISHKLSAIGRFAGETTSLSHIFTVSRFYF